MTVAGPAVDVVAGEYADRDSLDRALKGVRAAFLVTGSIGERDDVRFVEAARAAGVRHLVKLSALAVTDPAADDLITARQRENETAVRESGLAWTLLRPRAFMTNTLSWARSVREDGVVRALYGDAPNATVDPRDIAEVAALALTEPGAHEGRAYALSGPAAVTAAEQTALLGAALGRPLRFEELGPERACRAAGALSAAGGRGAAAQRRAPAGRGQGRGVAHGPGADGPPRALVRRVGPRQRGGLRLSRVPRVRPRTTYVYVRGLAGSVRQGPCFF